MDKSENNNLDLCPKIVYQPEIRETQLVRFKKLVEEKYKIKLKDFWELHAWSYKHFPDFWDCVWKFFDVVYSHPYTQVFDTTTSFTNMKWFKDVRFNYAENVLKYRDSQTALIAADDHDNVESVSYNELYEEVWIYVEALKTAGIQKGDYVTCYMANKIEAVFAFLATAAIGAIWSGALPMLGPKAVLSRFEQLRPKILFTAGNFLFENVEIKMEEKLPEIVAGLPSLQKVVFVSSKNKDRIEDISKIPKCVFMSEFLEHARFLRKEDGTKLQFEQVPFDYPLCVSFTSGTTGAPKGLIHSAGMFLAGLKDYGLHQDCTRKDTLFNFSPVGWISWHMFVNCLHLGLTLVMYEGYVDSDPMRFWDLIDKLEVTSSYIWCSTVENMERDGHGPTEKHSLKTLRQIFPMGSPAKPQSFDFLAEKVKPGLFCSPVYGCTEVYGLLSGLDSNLPVYRGEIQVLSLGMDIRILDEEGNLTIGTPGEVVLANPYPALPIRLINDENREMMKELYLSRYPGNWHIGDDAWRNPVTKGMIVYGRSDETLNPKGARFSCSEIYFALEGFPDMMDAVCVSQYNKNLDERVVLFVKMFPGHSLTTSVRDKIKETIERHLSVEHVPDIVMETPDIPNVVWSKMRGNFEEPFYPCPQCYPQDPRIRAYDNMGKSILLIRDPGPQDGGIYRCTATAQYTDGRLTTIYQVVNLI